MNSGMNDLVPSEFYLSRNYPNPFKDKTTIKFCVAYRTKVKLEVFNSEGKLVQKLLDEEKEAGTYEIEFDANGLAEGDYINQLQAGDFLSRKKMTLLH
jgi:5-hydroxyisourate hydrolase-like protein (transthyretin family)